MSVPGRGRWILVGVVLGAAAVAGVAFLWQKTHPPDVFRVARVVDGDTLVLDNGDRVRLKGASAPEHNEPWGSEATARLRQLVAGETVEVVRDSHDRGQNYRDHHGRLLAYITRRHDHLDVNAVLIKEGLARATPHYPGERREEYERYEKEARRAHLGLWSGRSPASPGPTRLHPALGLALLAAALLITAVLVLRRLRRQTYPIPHIR